MTVLLDTSFLIDLLSGEPAARSLAGATREPAAVSALSFYELLYALASPKKAARVEALAADYAVLPVDFDVCVMAASMQRVLRSAGETIPVLDALLAATAVLAEARIVTRDEHFHRIPAQFGLRVQAY
jgi:predicted nucleic acid-binding protein